VDEADCELAQAVQSILALAAQQQCVLDPASKNAITTDNAGIHITSPSDVCFHTGSDGDQMCVGAGLLPAIDRILAEQVRNSAS
jgi:hypothetical protein